MIKRISAFTNLCLLSMPSLLGAHEINPYFGGYKATNGESRSEGSVAGTLESGPYGSTGISSASYTVSGSKERIVVDEVGQDKYLEEYFPDGVREQNTVGLSTTHTFKKLTDLRLGGLWSSDSETTSKTWSAGLGHWWFHDSIQTNLDVSRTQTNRPSSAILDYDAETVLLAPSVSNGGATLSVKHLATPTTVWSAGYTRVEASDRPRLDAYRVALRQFIPPATASVHTSLTRIINTGPVTTETTSGSLAGLQAEIAFLKSLWQGAAARLGYRYAREDEETRAYGDHLVYGADSYTLGFTQDVKKGVVTDHAFTVRATATRYITNRGVSASLGEAGMAVRF